MIAKKVNTCKKHIEVIELIKESRKSESMENKLKKLNRRELLKILVAQQKEIESLQEQLKQCQASLESKTIRIANVGSLADASFALNEVIEHAQKAADQYLLNIQMREEDLNLMEEDLNLREAELKQKEKDMLFWCEEM